ncbi:UNVERIFIED_CONTAM: Retrovirus-related Pol polyprotein from transposon RE2 [Sesamum latifolium]|uniref:Retrovirus-related Pol polyprotein from transposon RE2 n=1 Tax=Sesamum latifolium TaxID=2727402 RepID=A0AAW2U5I8_9LAMI
MEDLKIQTSNHPGMVLVSDRLTQGQISIEEANTNAALLSKNVDIKRGARSFQKKKPVIDKKNQFCDYCSKSGHSQDACFKLYGYPEWFKEYSEQRKKGVGDAKALTVECEGRMPADQNSGHFASMGEFAVTENDLRHRRLGHTPILVLKHENVFKKHSDDLSICQACPLAKQQRLPFLLSEIHSKHVFKLVHVDIWGSYNQFSLSGCTYMLTVFDRKIKVVRTDNGLEFLSEKCQSFFLDKGIIHHKTCPYSPQQNGVVEREHKHLLQIARALMFQSVLPPKFWTVAVLIATFIINHLPTFVLQWRSPYEELYNKPVDYSVLKVFGCLAFATNLQPHKMKFTNRAHRCVFVGYVPGQKGYKDVVGHVPYSDPLPDDPDSSTTSPTPVIAYPTPTTTSPTPTISQYHLSDISVAPPLFPTSVSDSLMPSADFLIYQCLLIPQIQLHTYEASLSILQEPTTYAKANLQAEWRLAMKTELEALDQNHTWEVVPLPQGKVAIGCWWVYKLKLRANESIDMYKARLVAKDYSQVEGIDYNECFSPVAKVVTVRLFLAISTIFGWHIHQMDVNNAFFHGYLNEDIFMEAPEGSRVPTGHVCKLKRSLYGLKQASRKWNQEFTSKIVSFGFEQSKHDYCLFTEQSGSDFLVLLLYVDDILFVGSSTYLIAEVKVFLDKQFTIKDLGVAKYFLGLKIARSSQGIIVTEAKYTNDIVCDVRMEQARSTSTPLPPGIKFSADAGVLLHDPERYRRLVGRLLYLNFTRPDTSHATQQLSQFLQSPCQQHWDAALHLVRYLKGSMNKGLFFSS